MGKYKYSLSPDYIVKYWCRKNENIIGSEKEKISRTIKEESKKNLNVGYKRGNDLSLTSKKEIIKRVKWINEIGEVKNYKTKKGDIIQYKSSMITLTIPKKIEVEPAEITKVALNNFITLMRKISGMNNYVWKLELQKNGNVHYHIITDVEIDFFYIKKIWNNSLNLLGIIDDYSRQQRKIKFSDYEQKRIEEFKKYKKIGKLSPTQIKNEIKRTWEIGKKTQWKEPNTVNVKRIQLDYNIAGYIAKYISKDEKNSELQGKKIGRLWSSSSNLSKIKLIGENIQDILQLVYDYSYQVYKKKEIIHDYFSIIKISINWMKNLDDEIKERYNESLKKLNLVASKKLDLFSSLELSSS